MGSVWVSLPLHFATVLTYAGGTQVSTTKQDSEAGSSPASPGTVVLALVPVFGETVAFPVVFHSFPPSCLGKERGGQQEGKKKKEAKCRVPLLPSWSSRGAECQLSAGNCQGLTGAQPSAAEHEITSTGQEKGWLCTEGPGFSPQRGAKVK